LFSAAASYWKSCSFTGKAGICLAIAALVHLALGFSFELSVDEAHYLLYAKHLAWSYFDHPPLVGWIQWPLVSLDASTGVLRLVPELLWIISCTLVYIVTSELQRFLQSKASITTPALPPNGSSSFAAILIVIAAPIPHVLSVGLLPDSILTPLSLGLFWMALRWMQVGHNFTLRDWLITGILLGLAGLSKYTAAFTAFALLLVVLCPPRKPWINQAGFYLAVLLALLIISPVLYWNWANDWISFKYQLAHGSGGEWLFRRFAGFMGLQLVAFGLLFAVGMVFFLRRYWAKSPAAISLPARLFLDSIWNFCLALRRWRPSSLDYTSLVLLGALCRDWYCECMGNTTTPTHSIYFYLSDYALLDWLHFCFIRRHCQQQSQKQSDC
jgi:4-amino-4-deoxy-L-arabinose transferase-like glycosyltransferase